MARVSYIRPIESLHGKLGKKDVVGYAMRTKSYAKYTVTRDSWKLNISEAKQAGVLAHRAKFKAVAQQARNRMKNAQTRLIDEAAWKAQSKYTTFFGYLFHDEWESYED